MRATSVVWQCALLMAAMINLLSAPDVTVSWFYLSTDRAPHQIDILAFCSLVWLFLCVWYLRSRVPSYIVLLPPAPSFMPVDLFGVSS